LKFVKVNDELYCKIFVDTQLFNEQLISLLATLLKTTSHGAYVENNYLLITVNRNEDRNDILKNNLQDGFLFYQYYLDIEPSKTTNFELYLQQLKFLVAELRSKGMSVVPSCDFEDELNDGKFYTEFMK
jgi:hypothetical protein